MLIRLVAPVMILLSAFSGFSQDKPIRVGEIEFFGTNGQAVDRLRKSLPLQEGDEISFAVVSEAVTQLKQAITQATGSEPTDLARVCCDEHGGLMLYIGLRGRATQAFKYNPDPRRALSLPESIVRVYEQMMDITFEAVKKQASEERSQGFSLSTYPPLRAKELAMREYAICSEPLVRRVLLLSADPKQRAIAANVLGYARQSRGQITALVRASHDSNDEVRNNAVRALAVLAHSSSKIASQIPPYDFIDMLNSGKWTDRNKGALLIEILSAARDPQLLHEIRLRSLPSLIEMARWRSAGHASDARMILGRIAGIEETRLTQLAANGNVDEIIRSLKGGN